MPSFGRESQYHLRTVEPRLQALFERVVEGYDCKVLCGYRGQTEQHAAFVGGYSTLDWPDGKHNQYPSRAVDIAPYPVDWEDAPRFYHFAGFVEAVALDMGLSLRWGGDWDSDRDFSDQTFNDLTHFELK